MNAKTVSAAAADSLRGYWEQAESYQRFLYAAGTLLVLSAVFHAVVLVVTGGTLEGDVSWRKPILFGESFGLTCISIAWILTFLPRRGWLGWPLAGALGLANSGEVFWVSLQQWRGVASHFNNSTAFDSTAFAAAGVLILIAAVVLLAVTLLSFVALRAPASFAWAIRAGLLVLIAGQIFGLMMIQNDGNTFGAAGAGKVPHALAIHAPQALPLLAWLLSMAPWSERWRTATVIAGAAGYALVLAVSAFQAYSGRAPLDLEPGAALVLSLGGLLVAGAFARALLGLGQGGAQAAATARG